MGAGAKYLSILLLIGCGYELSAAPVITTVAGTGEPDLGLFEGEALSVNIKDPFGVEVGPDGALYITEVGHHRILRLDRTTGRITTVAGSGRKGYSGDGGPAVKADLNEPYEIRFDRNGDFYVVEMMNHLVRKVEVKTGTITTVAGTGRKGFSGDGGPAREATFNRPHSIALDHERNHLYIADIGNHRIRRVDLTTGVVETYAGNGVKKWPRDGSNVRGKPMIGPRALFTTPGVLWVALREGHSVWKIDLNKDTIVWIAGTGKKGYSGDGSEAKQATLNGPKGIALGPRGDIYVVDTENQAIRQIHMKTGTISSLAGFGPKGKGFNGEDIEASTTKMGRPHGVCVDAEGAVYVGDTLNHRVRKIR